MFPCQSNWNEVFIGLQWIITDTYALQWNTNCSCLEWFKHSDLRCCWHCVNIVISNVCCHGVSIVILNVADIASLMVTLWDTEKYQCCCWQKRGDQLYFVLMVVFQATYTLWFCYFPIWTHPPILFFPSLKCWRRRQQVSLHCLWFLYLNTMQYIDVPAVNANYHENSKLHETCCIF
jgi:hypothetical protein